MKVLYILLPALLLSSVKLFAESKSQDGITGITITGGWFPHFKTQASGAVSHNSRLVAKVFSRYSQSDFEPVDSVVYAYKNGRGGETKKDEPNNDENILFDESITFIYNPFVGAYDNRLYRLQTFNSENKVKTLTYKTWHKIHLDWKDSARYSYLYNNGIMVSSILEIAHGTFWTKHVESDLVYDGNNNVTAMNSTGYVAKFSYDANNNLVSMVDSQLTSSGWILNERKSFAYTQTGKVAVYTTEKWDNTAGKWINNNKSEYTYSGNNIATKIEYSWVGNNWVPAARHSYTYDSNNNKTSDIQEDWKGAVNAFVNSKKETWDYNNHNQPVKIVASSWNGSTWYHAATDEQIVFYYEYYYPTGIEENIAGVNDVQVYPTLATSNINVKASWNENQSSVICLYDMQGRVSGRWEYNNTNSVDMSIPVYDLAPGNYIVKVVGENSQHTSRVTISK